MPEKLYYLVGLDPGVSQAIFNQLWCYQTWPRPASAWGSKLYLTAGKQLISLLQYLMYIYFPTMQKASDVSWAQFSGWYLYTWSYGFDAIRRASILLSLPLYFQDCEKKKHQTLSARESMCIIAWQNCINDNFTGNLELGWRKQQKKHHGEHSCTGKDREQPCIFSIFSSSDFLNAYT